MSNSVTYDRRPDIPAVRMSNRGTSEFVEVLCLATSDLAANDHERELAVWIASRDQGIFGLGLVGFDVSDLPWDVRTFTSDRNFVLRAIDAALDRKAWDRLGYDPREDRLFENLKGFRALVAAFDVADATMGKTWEWPFESRPTTFERCPKHAIYCHPQGCTLCTK
jgi:hypothetical protein